MGSQSRRARGGLFWIRREPVYLACLSCERVFPSLYIYISIYLFQLLLLITTKNTPTCIYCSLDVSFASEAIHILDAHWTTMHIIIPELLPQINHNLALSPKLRPHTRPQLP